MRFDADVELVVDGTRAHVSGAGGCLIVDAADPAKLLQTMRRTARPASRRDLARIADGLAALGASVRLQGPHGHLLTVGADANAPVLRPLTGTRHAAPGSGRGLLSLVNTMVPPRWRRLAGAGAMAVATLIGARRLHRSARQERA